MWGAEGGNRDGAGVPMWGEDQGVTPQFGELRSGERGWQCSPCGAGAGCAVTGLVFGRATISLRVKPSPLGDRAGSFPLAPSPFWGMFRLPIKRPLPP